MATQKDVAIHRARELTPRSALFRFSGRILQAPQMRIENGDHALNQPCKETDEFVAP